MIQRYLYPNQAPLEAVTPSPANVAKPSEPTEADLKVEFTEDPAISEEIAIKDPSTKEVVELLVKKEEKATPLLPHKAKPVALPPKQELVKKIEPILPPSATPKARDYTGFTDEEAKVLKEMSGPAFDFTKNLLKEHKELVKLKDTQFYQSPDAYVLDPAYKKVQEDVHFLNSEAMHWQEQLVAISEGKEWTPITGWNGNQPVYGAAQQPSKLHEEQVRMAMNQCFSAAQQAKANAQQFVTNYQERIKGDTEAINKECAQRFGWVADPALMESKIEVPGIGEQSIKQIHSEFSNLFPPYLKNTIGVNVASHLWVALQIFGQQIRELKNGQAITDIKEEEKTLTEPTSKARPSSEGMTAGEIKEFSMEGFPS